MFMTLKAFSLYSKHEKFGCRPMGCNVYHLLLTSPLPALLIKILKEDFCQQIAFFG